jgi:pimeloyl-ACP methyl ester carboxylesterase
VQIQANGLSLEVDIQGPADGTPLVLLMGLGMQLTGWPEPFVEMLAQRRYKVIRLDNRDAGLSQGFDDRGTPNVAWAALRYAFRLRVRSVYSIADMAADTVGVLDALGIDRAHIAARHPQRVSALTLMMTTSGARSLPKPSAKARAAMLDRRGLDGKNIEAVVDRLERVFTVIGSPAYRPADEPAREAFRARLRASVQRAYRPGGVARQLIAVAADGDRSPLLARITAPTHIVHGALDPLVPVASAHDLRHKINRSTLDIIEGMGHDLPQALWSRLAELISSSSESVG